MSVFIMCYDKIRQGFIRMIALPICLNCRIQEAYVFIRSAYYGYCVLITILLRFVHDVLHCVLPTFALFSDLIVWYALLR